MARVASRQVLLVLLENGKREHSGGNENYELEDYNTKVGHVSPTANGRDFSYSSPVLSPLAIPSNS